MGNLKQDKSKININLISSLMRMFIWTK